MLLLSAVCLFTFVHGAKKSVQPNLDSKNEYCVEQCRVHPKAVRTNCRKDCLQTWYRR